MRNWLDGSIQRVVVNGSMSRWRLVTNAVPQGSLLGPVLFNIFTNDLDRGIKCTLSKFADDTKLSGVVNVPEGWHAIQRDHERLERWAHVNLMRFNKNKSGVLQLGRGHPWNPYDWRMKGLRADLLRRTLGCWLMKKLDMSHQRVLAAQKANHTLDCMPSSMGSRAREGILPLCSALVRPHREPCGQLWSPQHRKDMDLLEQGQRRHKIDQRAGAPLLGGKAERAGAIQPGEEKAAGRPYCGLPVLTGGL